MKEKKKQRAKKSQRHTIKLNAKKDWVKWKKGKDKTWATGNKRQWQNKMKEKKKQRAKKSQRHGIKQNARKGKETNRKKKAKRKQMKEKRKTIRNERKAKWSFFFFSPFLHWLGLLMMCQATCKDGSPDVEKSHQHSFHQERKAIWEAGHTAISLSSKRQPIELGKSPRLFSKVGTSPQEFNSRTMWLLFSMPSGKKGSNANRAHSKEAQHITHFYHCPFRADY